MPPPFYFQYCLDGKNDDDHDAVHKNEKGLRFDFCKHQHLYFYRFLFLKKRTMWYTTLEITSVPVGCWMHLGIATLGLPGHAKTSRVDRVVRGPGSWDAKDANLNGSSITGLCINGTYIYIYTCTFIYIYIYHQIIMINFGYVRKWGIHMYIYIYTVRAH